MDTRKKMLGSRLLAGLLSLVLVVGMLPAAGALNETDPGTGNTGGEVTPTTPPATDPPETDPPVEDKITGINITTSPSEVFEGEKVTFHATVQGTGTFSKEIEWSCSSGATIDESSGELTGETAGKVTVTATAKGDTSKTDTAEIMVKKKVVSPDSINIDGGDFSLNVGGNKTMSATVLPDGANQEVEWSSGNSSIVRIDGNKAIAVSKGNTTITATSKANSSISASCNVEVTDNTQYSITLPSSLNVPLNNTGTILTATVSPDNAEIIWEASPSGIVTITGSGKTVTIKPTTNAKVNNTVTISAKIKDHEDKSASCTVTITDSGALSLDKNTLSIAIGGTGTLTLTNSTGDSNVKITSSDNTAATATISGNKITVTVPKTAQGGKKPELTISAGGQSVKCIVTVTDPTLKLSATSLNLSNGKSQTLSVSGIPTGATSKIDWSSSDKSYVTVDSSGKVTAKSTGKTVTISANVTINGKAYNTLTCKVTVGNIADTIEYSTNGDDVVHFVASDFNRVCNDVFGGSTRLDYIVFTSVPSSYGTLYYDYSTNTGRGEKVTDTSNSSNNYGYNSSSTYYKRLIEDLTFVPQSSTDRTITIEYTGYVNNSRDSFTGKIEITIGASGNLNYTIAKNDILELDADDFNSFFKKSSSTSGSLDYIVFNKLPSSSSGTLYFKYDKDSNRNTAVARNEKYYDRGTDAIDDVTFVAADGYTGTVTIPFTAYGSGSNNNVSGTLSIKVGKKGDSDIAYTTDRNTPVQVNIRDFNQFCEDATGDSRVDYVTFSLPSSNRGTLYGVYSSSNSSSQNTALKSSTRCYRNPGSKDIALDDVTFVPASGYTGTISISFSGYSSSGKKFSGTMKITVGKDSGDITYTADSGQVITFKLADFTEYCKDELGSKATLDYVTFDQPAASKGTLYYDYSNNSGTQVKSSTRYYRNEKPYLDQVSFVPARNLTGTVQIPFSGRSTAKEEFEGVIVINYNTIKEPGVIRYTTNGSPVPFSLQDFTRACNERGGAQLDFVKFPIPDSTCGKLYSGYRSAAQNSGQISPNLTYRVSGTPPLAEVVFVPKAGYTGLARLNYTGTDKNGTEFSGVVEITITAPTSSGTFADVGANYSWAAASVDYLYRAGVVTGTDATHFAPAQNITRGDFVLMLYRAFGLQNAGTASFTDVPQDSYYAQAIAAAKAMGIATGGGGGTFNPTSPLTRQDAMLLIQRTINATGGSLRDGAEASLSTFADRGNVAPYAQGAVSALVQAGIIKGDNAGRLNPTGSLSRAEMATILHRVLTM